jgi:hypothetical protein
MSRSGPPPDAWPCEHCCPATIFLVKREIARVPVMYHVSEDCPELKRERNPRHPELEAHDWPEATYERIVWGSGFRRCVVCGPTDSVLYPLGSPERPA